MLEAGRIDPQTLLTGRRRDKTGTRPCRRPFGVAGAIFSHRAGVHKITSGHEHGHDAGPATALVLPINMHETVICNS